MRSRKSWSLIPPPEDPSTLFISAGMQPLKPYFSGQKDPPAPRFTNVQKVLRAGGKDTDLEDVGRTDRHCSFFEMLGNFSFGDYFKEQAILLAWELLTKEWGLAADKLTATVYHTDDDAFDLWKKIAGLPESRIVRIATQLWLPIAKTPEAAQLLETAARNCPVHQSLHPSIDKPMTFHWAGE